MTIAMRLQYCVAGVLVLTSVWPSRALAQDHDAHMMASQHQPQTAEQKKQGNALVKIVRDVTERFRVVSWLKVRGMVSSSAASAGGTIGRWVSTS